MLVATLRKSVNLNVGIKIKLINDKLLLRKRKKKQFCELKEINLVLDIFRPSPNKIDSYGTNKQKFL